MLFSDELQFTSKFPGYWANLFSECWKFSALCLLNVEDVIVQIWQNIFYTSIHWGRQTEILLLFLSQQWSELPVLVVPWLVTGESSQTWEMRPDRWQCSFLFDAETARQPGSARQYKSVAIMLSVRGGELVASWPSHSATTWQEVLYIFVQQYPPAITSRDRYDLSQDNNLTPLQRAGLLARHCQTVRWGVRCPRSPDLYFVRWSAAHNSALATVFTSLVTVTTDKQRKADSQSLARAQLQSVGEISEIREIWEREISVTVHRHQIFQPQSSCVEAPVFPPLPVTHLVSAHSLTVWPWPQSAGGPATPSLSPLTSQLYQGTLTFLSLVWVWLSRDLWQSRAGGGSRKINLKFLASLRYLSAMFVIEGSQ